MNENRLWLIIIGVLAVTTILDMTTAFKSPIFEVAETNPFYIQFKSVIALVSITLIATIWMLYRLKKALSIGTIFAMCLSIIYLSAGHLIGTYSNVNMEKNYNGMVEFKADDYTQSLNMSYESARALAINNSIQEIRQASGTDRQKLSYYWGIVGLFLGIPILLSYIAFAVAMKFYDLRKPERERIMENAYNELRKIYK